MGVDWCVYRALKNQNIFLGEKKGEKTSADTVAEKSNKFQISFPEYDVFCPTAENRVEFTH